MILRFFTDGGAFMWAILGISLFAFAFIIERYYALSSYFQFDEDYFEGISRLIRQGDLNRAVTACQKADHPLSIVMLRVMAHLEHDSDAIEERTSIEFQKIIPSIQKRTGYIQMLGNVSTLLGLLGTIYGLITSFSSLTEVSSSARAEVLSQGISTAMNTTAFGLLVAIPCVIAYSYLSGEESAILQRYEATLNDFAQALKRVAQRENENQAAQGGLL